MDMDASGIGVDDRASAEPPIAAAPWRQRLVRTFGLTLTVAVLAGAGWIASRPKARGQVASWFSMGHPQIVDQADDKVRAVTNKLHSQQ